MNLDFSELLNICWYSSVIHDEIKNFSIDSLLTFNCWTTWTLNLSDIIKTVPNYIMENLWQCYRFYKINHKQDIKRSKERNAMLSIKEKINLHTIHHEL